MHLISRGQAQRSLCIHIGAPRGKRRRRQCVRHSQLVSIHNVNLSVGEAGRERKILDNIHFTVAPGELHMVVGPNGCGKSTMLRLIGGLATCDSGQVEVEGPCAFVFQNPDNQVVMPTTAAEVALGTGTQHLSNADVVAKVRSALERVGMWDFAEVSTSTLSGGQKQRLAIASALAQGPPAPKVLLLDELTTFLDAEDAQAVLESVHSVVAGADRVAAIWVTHRLEELQFADHVTYMDGGRVLRTGSPQHMLGYLRALGAAV
eukprot:jgi/Ulvmu1/10258/UM060_0059.1